MEAHLGKTIADVLKDFAHGGELQLHHGIQTGEPIIKGEVELETMAHPGESRHYMHNYYPDKNKDGTVVGVSCVVQYVTHRMEPDAGNRSHPYAGVVLSLWSYIDNSVTVLSYY